MGQTEIQDIFNGGRNGKCSSGDRDGDGFADSLDNCPVDENPGQEDANMDGIGDACENTPIAGSAAGSGASYGGLGGGPSPNPVYGLEKLPSMAAPEFDLFSPQGIFAVIAAAAALYGTITSSSSA